MAQQLGEQSPPLLRLARVGVALGIFAAIGIQVVHNIQSGSFLAANFFSFFTIDSNIIAAAALLAAAYYDVPSRAIGIMRGAATLYMTVTFVIYATILATPNDILLLGVNLTLHYGAPLALMLDWVIAPPGLVQTSMRTVSYWLIFPTLYVVYTLIRGPIAAWYPYPFLDVRLHGYPTVLIICGVLTIAFLGIGMLLALWARRKTNLTA